MVLKTYRVEFTATASTAWKKYADLVTPSGKTRRFRELRIYFSSVGDVQVRIYYETEFIVEIDSRVWNEYKLPLPLDVEVVGGLRLNIEANNNTSSNITIVIEFIVDETTA